ncbi:DUF2637 domain-containing protein [Streptomyces sp. NBC_00654]|uniref:DUF2637 domain-containing protein n=1 Tax=Streptomyces sp. NBC_00654 TaxID=2975799 RepID=UPI002250A2F8|nr:DUF2637 domain-containing protein [Streptomyces sp. NBC_00654]MCX4963977.1 DUF2637 domain-containing protein [Streptomyces sp. NBC_00654]
MAAMQLTRTHRILIGVVVAGAVLIAAIGFAGSYAAVRELAEQKGFGDFSLVFPIGIDAGICVLLALDLLLTWMRIPFPLLRQTAWLLTAATIAFNGAAAWPDPLGTGMHAVIPVLFVVSVEAARHAVGRIADITADKHMEGVRLTRWLLSPVPTFKLWRRMKLWELRSYEQVIKLEQDRLIYQARLQARFGRNWRRKAPIESMMPLRLAKYGVPLAETAPAGLAAAGIEPALLPPVGASQPKAELPYAPQQEHEQGYDQGYDEEYDKGPEQQGYGQEPYGVQHPQQQQHPQQHPQHQQQPQQQHLPQQGPGSHDSPWFAAPQVPDNAHESAYNPTYVEGLEPTPVKIPSGPGRTRPLGNVGTIGAVPHPRGTEAQQHQPHPPYQQPGLPALREREQERQPEQERPEEGPQEPDADRTGTAEPAIPPSAELAAAEAEFTGIAYEVYAAYTHQNQNYPSLEILDIHLSDGHNVRHPDSAALLRRLMPEFKKRFDSEMEADHIA